MNIKKLLKKWLGVDEDIHQAVEETRKQVTAQLSSRHKSEIASSQSTIATLQQQLAQASERMAEKDAAMRRLEEVTNGLSGEIRKQVTEQVTAEKDAVIAKLNTDHSKEVAELRDKLKNFSEVEKQLTTFREAVTTITAKAGPGRPRKDREAFNISIDKGLKEMIALLERLRVFKRGAVSDHVNEELWAWIQPMVNALETDNTLDEQGMDALPSSPLPHQYTN